MHNFLLLYDSIYIYTLLSKISLKILCVGVDFKQNVDLLPSLYAAKSMAVDGRQKSEILLKIKPKTRFSMKFCTLVYKYIFSHIVKRNYAYVPKIYFYRLINFVKKKKKKKKKNP